MNKHISIVFLALYLQRFSWIIAESCNIYKLSLPQTRALPGNIIGGASPSARCGGYGIPTTETGEPDILKN